MKHRQRPQDTPGVLLPIPAPTPGLKTGLIQSPEVLIETFFRDKDPKTIRAYKRCLEDFREWLEPYLKARGVRSPGVLTQDGAARFFLGGGQGQANLLALEWKSQLIKDGYAPSSVNTHLVALRSLVKVARLLGMVSWTIDVDNVASEVYRDTAGPGTDRFVQVMKELEKRTDPVGLRDRAVLALIHDAGLRRDEVHSLDLEHIDWIHHRAWVQAKKKTSRVAVPINGDVERCLKAWIRERGDAPGSLFKNFDLEGKGKGLSGNGIARISHKYGLGRPHGLRHLAITEALEVTGGNITEVMKFSRHKDPKTVIHYNDNRKNVSGEISEKLSKLRREGK